MNIMKTGACTGDGPFFTLEMLFDYLASRGFLIVRRPSKPVCFSRAVPFDEFAATISHKAGGKDCHAFNPSAFRNHLVVFGGEADEAYRDNDLIALRRANEMGLPVLGFVSERYPESLFEQVIEGRRTSLGLVSLARAENGAESRQPDLICSVLRFLLDEHLFVNRLSVAAGERGSLQNLVDIAEERFESFANITDAHYRLLAYTKNHQPDDEINRSLVDLGYHCEEHLHRQHTMGYLLESVAKQRDSKVWPPDDTFPYYLMTGVMRISGQYAGHVLVTSALPPTQGELDVFNIFLAYCDRFVRRSMGCISLKESPKQAFISQLVATREVDGAFVRERAEFLNLPVAGVFVLARLVCGDAFNGQAGHIAEDIDSRLNIDHVTFVREGRANVLLHAESIEDLWKALVFAGKMEYGLTQASLFISDPFFRLQGLFYAAREIDMVARCEREIMISLRSVESENLRTFAHGRTRILSFRDAFVFCRQDLFDDEGFTGFVLSHLLVTLIENGGKGTRLMKASERMENLAFLYIFLSNERRATQVGAMCGLHRNGVLYRIQKMEKDYGIDLDDVMTREYLLASIRVKLSSSRDFRERFDCAVSGLLRSNNGRSA